MAKKKFRRPMALPFFFFLSLKTNYPFSWQKDGGVFRQSFFFFLSLCRQLSLTTSEG